MNKELKEEVKKAIHNIEFYGTGLSSLNGVYVEVTNLSSKEDKYVANISIINQEEGTTTKYKNVEYPKQLIEQKIKK